MSERLPVPAGGTEAAGTTMLDAGFYLHWLGRGAHPAPAATNEAEMQMAIAGPNLAFPLLIRVKRLGEQMS